MSWTNGVGRACGLLLDAIVRLLGDDVLRRRLGQSGRALYLDRFTWRAAWRKLEEAGL